MFVFYVTSEAFINCLTLKGYLRKQHVQKTYFSLDLNIILTKLNIFNSSTFNQDMVRVNIRINIICNSLFNYERLHPKRITSYPKKMDNLKCVPKLA